MPNDNSREGVIVGKKQNSLQQKRFHDKKTSQPDSAKSHTPGVGDKKLDGPNRPST